MATAIAAAAITDSARTPGDYPQRSRENAQGASEVPPAVPRQESNLRSPRRGDVSQADDRAVGQLLITPAPERLHEVMSPISRNTLLWSVASGSL